MKKLLVLFLLIASPVVAAPDFISTANELLGNPDTCLELKYDLDNGSNLTDHIYINDENKRVVFANGLSSEILEYNDNIIKFKTIENDINNKGYVIETFYEINRYTGGCTIEKYKKAVGAMQKFDNVMFGLNQTFLYRKGTGLVKKVDSTTKKF